LVLLLLLLLLLLQVGLVKLVADYVIRHHYPHVIEGEQQQQQQAQAQLAGAMQIVCDRCITVGMVVATFFPFSVKRMYASVSELLRLVLFCSAEGFSAQCCLAA
jgi:flagellar biosynthesis protein FlhB